MNPLLIGESNDFTQALAKYTVGVAGELHEVIFQRWTVQIRWAFLNFWNATKSRDWLPWWTSCEIIGRIISNWFTQRIIWAGWIYWFPRELTYCKDRWKVCDLQHCSLLTCKIFGFDCTRKLDGQRCWLHLELHNTRLRGLKGLSVFCHRDSRPKLSIGRRRRGGRIWR